MKNFAFIILFGIAVSFAANYEFVFPEKIELQLVSPKASSELVKLAEVINKKCPLEPIAKTDPADSAVKSDSLKKVSAKKDPVGDAFNAIGTMLVQAQKSADSVKKGRNPLFNVALEGVSVDDKYIIFALRYPASVPEDSLFYLLTKISMIGSAIIEGGEATYGNQNNPFSEKNLKKIVKNGVKIVLRAVTRNGKYVDYIVENSLLPIPYIDVPHKNVKKVNGFPAVEIGSQTWMAQNVNKKTPRSKCYENREKNCKQYGRLYTIEDARKVCPAGWHLPTGSEFEKLAKFVKDSKKLRSKNYNEWGKSVEGTDDYGFNAHPSGMGYELVKFKDGPVPPPKEQSNPNKFSFSFDSRIAPSAYFWTADMPTPESKESYYFDVVEGFYISMGAYSNAFSEGYNIIRESVIAKKIKGELQEGSDPKKAKLWLSVRCIKNE